jgi:hypothetical protein
MRHDGVLVVMRGEFVGGPVGSWQAMYTQWNKITNQLYRYSNWDHLERDIYHLFNLDQKELNEVRPALTGCGSVHIEASPKHSI